MYLMQVIFVIAIIGMKSLFNVSDFDFNLTFAMPLFDETIYPTPESIGL